MAREIDTKLLQLEAEDGRSLDALLYPGLEEPTVGILHLHGKGGSLLGGPGRFVPPRWPAVTHLSLNMRFHDLAYTRMDLPSPDFTVGQVPVDGGYWETIADGHIDVAAGVAALRARGCEHIFLTGHSSGGFYTADYCRRDPEITGRILLSPLTANRTALPVWFPADADLRAALDEAREFVRRGDPDRLLVLDSWYYAIAARSLLERADEPDGVWLEAMNQSNAPVLFLWGGLESRDTHWREQFEALTSPHKQTVVIPGMEHNFVGFEQEVTDAIQGFVNEVVNEHP